ncbi:MAG: helix-turn-helix domain-containing protein [Bryobacteraceae bacterium]
MSKKSLACASQTTLSKQQLTDIEVARYLTVSVSTVRRWRLTGGGPRWIRIEGSIRYPPADLESYVATLPSGGGALARVCAKPLPSQAEG